MKQRLASLQHFWLKLKFILEYSTHLQTDNNPPLELIFKFKLSSLNLIRKIIIEKIRKAKNIINKGVSIVECIVELSVSFIVDG